MRTLLLGLCCCMLFLGGTTVRGAVPHDNCRLTEVAQHRPKQYKPKHHKYKKKLPPPPPPVHHIKYRPAHCVPFYYRNAHYFYANGIFYREAGRLGYEIIKPVIGMVIPVMPARKMKKVRVKNEILFLYDGVLYRKISTPKGIHFEVRGFL